MANDSEKNSFTNRRNKSCALKPTCSQNTKSGHISQAKFTAEVKHSINSEPIDEDGENSLTKPNARASTNSEKGVGRISYVTNGIISLPSKLVHHSKGKGNGPCQNPHGETSSESYSSPSSPQFDGRESLENGDDKGKDTDSHSDDPRKSVAHTVLVCPVTGGATNDLHTLVPPENQEIHPQDSLQGTVVEFPHFAHHTPCTNFNGPEVLASVSSLQVSDSKADTELMMPHPLVIPTSSATIDGSEKCSSEAPSAFQSFSASVCSLKSPSSSVLQPILQRFKTAGAQPGTKNSVLVPPAHQSSLSATGVLQSGPAYPPALQSAYSNTDPVLSSVTLAESHTKSTGLTLSSVLPPSFSLPVPTTGMSPTGIVGIASSSQVSALVVPTHMPGPTPSPIPALTHSTAQSDGSSYINSSASNSIPQLQRQQLPAAQQLLGCNACRCRGSCGNNHANYYFPTQMPPQQVFNVPPVFQLSSLSSSSYLTQISHTQQSNGDTQMPFYPSAPSAFAGGTLVHPRCHSRSDHVTGSQAASFGLQQMTAFTRFYQPIYTAMVPGASSGPAMGLGTVSGGINKKNGSIYCCNCGGSGHYAQDCKQLPFDATQQGGFRLKYAPNSEALDGNPD